MEIFFWLIQPGGLLPFFSPSVFISPNMLFTNHVTVGDWWMGTCLCCPVSVPSHPFDSSSLLECVLPHLCTALFHWLLVYVGICLFSPICILPCPIGSSSVLEHVCISVLPHPICSTSVETCLCCPILPQTEPKQHRAGARKNRGKKQHRVRARRTWGKKKEPKQCTARAEKAAKTELGQERAQNSIALGQERTKATEMGQESAKAT